MAKILIKNGRVWDGEKFLNADVLTDGDKIEKIEPDISDNANFVYDAEGKTVSAGLVDAHVHLRVKPDDEYGIQAEMSCFPFGVTSAADAGRTRGELFVLDSFMLKNVVFVTAKIYGNSPDLEGLSAAIERFGKRTVGVKVYFDETLGEARDITPLREICEFAKRRGLKVMVHCSNSPTPMSEILDTLSAGDILTHVYHGGKNNASEDGFECVRRAKERGVVIDSGFAGYVHTDFTVLKEAFDRGVFPDTVSTDITKFSAYTRGGRYGMPLCMSLARYFGMSEENIFCAVTSAPAKALWKANEWGYLRVGRQADIAVFDCTDGGFDMTDKNGVRVISKEGYRCVLTVADGQIVYKD